MVTETRTEGTFVTPRVRVEEGLGRYSEGTFVVSRVRTEEGPGRYSEGTFDVPCSGRRGARSVPRRHVPLGVRKKDSFGFRKG